MRRKLLLLIATALLPFAAAVMATAYFLGVTIAPLTPSYVHTTGTVTGQRAHLYKGNDACSLTISFILNGQPEQEGFESGNGCNASPQPGTQLRLTVNPSNAKDLMVLGRGYFGEYEPYYVGFMGLIVIGTLSLYLAVPAFSYRRARKLLSKGLSWREITVTVKSRQRGRGGATLILESEDVAGKSRVFVLSHSGNGPWRPYPKPSEKLEFALLSDGTSSALLSIAGDHRLWIAGLSVPTSFELRAMGL